MLLLYLVMDLSFSSTTAKWEIKRTSHCVYINIGHTFTWSPWLPLVRYVLDWTERGTGRREEKEVVGNFNVVTQSEVASLPILYFPPVVHTLIHTHTHTVIHSKPQLHTHCPSWLFLAVFWAIFRPLPVSSHLAERDLSQHKGTGLTPQAYVSVGFICF